MDIKKGLKTLQWHSETAKFTLSNIIEILDKLDVLDNINPATDDERQDLIGQKDDELVKFYNCLQAFLDYQEEFRNNLCSTGVERELTSKLLENDTDPDEVIRRSGEIYAGLFQEYYYPNVWEESVFKAKIQSLKTDLKDRIVNRLMREDEIPELKDRLVVSGLNEGFISEEPMTLESAKRKAGDWVLWLDLYLHNVCRLQNEVATILYKAHSILNPQSQPTETQEAARDHNSLLDDEEIIAVFDEIVSIGFMTRDTRNRELYWWETDNVLLSYLCSQISRYKELSNQMRNGDYLPNWKAFNGLFKVKGENGEWVDADNIKLGEYKKQYKKNHGGLFNPDGCQQIDKIVSRHLT